LKCCISKIYYMSLVKYIARLQRFNLLIARKAVDPPDELVFWWNLSRVTVSATLQAEKGIHFVVKQSWMGTYLTDDHTSIWCDPYQSISGYSNRLPGTYINNCHYYITIHLIRLKVFPTYRTADYLAWSAVR
jgi:hypothetical protein